MPRATAPAASRNAEASPRPTPSRTLLSRLTSGESEDNVAMSVLIQRCVAGNISRTVPVKLLPSAEYAFV